MKRLKIMKVYFIFWLFLYFLVSSNLDLVWIYFSATLTFNIAVLTILAIGTIIIMSSAFQLVNLAGTFGILAYKKQGLEFYLQGIERVMPANIAHMFHSRAKKNVLLFTQDESREVVNWLDEKFANQKAYINFFIGTALMIGLFGTFTGLLKSIDEMGRIILSLSGDIDLAEVIADFAGPLSGMAIGFGSSLFGVASAIILGIKGYILSRNQEMFIVGVEDWLKGRIIEKGAAGAGGIGGDGGFAGGGGGEKGSFADLFLEKISDLSKDIRTLNETNEKMRIDITRSLENNSTISQESRMVLEDLSKNVEKVSMEKSEEILTEVASTLSLMEKKLEAEKDIIEDISDHGKKRSKDLHSQIDIINETLESIEIKLEPENFQQTTPVVKEKVVSVNKETSSTSPAEKKEIEKPKPSNNQYKDLFKDD